MKGNPSQVPLALRGVSSLLCRPAFLIGGGGGSLPQMPSGLRGGLFSPARASKVIVGFLQKCPTSWDGSQVPLALRDLPRHRVGLSLTTSRQPPARLQEKEASVGCAWFRFYLPPLPPFSLS